MNASVRPVHQADHFLIHPYRLVCVLSIEDRLKLSPKPRRGEGASELVGVRLPSDVPLSESWELLLDDSLWGIYMSYDPEQRV